MERRLLYNVIYLSHDYTGRRNGRERLDFFSRVFSLLVFSSFLKLFFCPHFLYLTLSFFFKFLSFFQTFS